MAFCKNCGHELGENQKFCTNCGTLQAAESSKEPVQKVEAENKTYDAVDMPAKENSPSAKNFLTTFFNRRNIVILSAACVLILLIGVFFKQIKGGYFLARYKFENTPSKKYEYALKSIANINTNSAYNAFIESSTEMVKQNPDSVEAKLFELKNNIKSDDYKKLVVRIYNEKIEAACASKNFDEALGDLIKLQQNGGKIKENPKYEAILLNAVSKSLGISVYNSKEELKTNANILFYPSDENDFDQLIEIKDFNPKANYEKQYDVTLYKLINGKFSKVSTLKIPTYSYIEDYGVYSYDKNKSGFFISLTETSYVSSASVYRVKNDKLDLVGTVGSNDPCSVQDFDNDGIFEIAATELYDPTGQYSHADMPRITRYYKFSDGGKPRIVKEDRPSVIISTPAITNPSAQVSAQNSEYIFSDSDKRYLTDSEVSPLSKEQLGFARNEIYARHGYVFKTEKYAQYFSSKSWYKSNPSFVPGDENLNQYEIKNYTLIQKYEK